MIHNFNPSKIMLKRQAKGLTQQELATRAGVSGSTICLLESGKKEPRVNTFAAVARALQTRMEYFFTE